MLALIRQLAAIAIAIVVLPLAACDPAYYRAPVDWLQPSPGIWVRHFDGFTLRAPGLSGLAGTWWLSPIFEIRENDLPVALLSATLITASGSYPATINHLYGTVPKGGGHLMPDWNFGREHLTPRVLGDHSRIVLEMLVGSRSLTVSIEYDRGGWHWA